MNAHNLRFPNPRHRAARVKQIVPQNEEALDYLVHETQYSVFQDGSSVLFSERVGDFISDASHAHLCCEYV